jgi:hypothetical protein
MLTRDTYPALYGLVSLLLRLAADEDRDIDDIEADRHAEPEIPSEIAIPLAARGFSLSAVEAEAKAIPEDYLALVAEGSTIEYPLVNAFLEAFVG